MSNALSTNTPPPILNSANITTNLINSCLTVYPQVLERVYKSTRPKANQYEILEDATWRYEQLPAIVSSRSNGPGRGPQKKGKAETGLSKDELARLVKWKITHGTNRPFLPSMIQKNSPSEILTSTTQAFKTLSQLSPRSPPSEITATIESALTEVCVLKGVGPATGTLVLSICHPDIIPFFEDELYEWLFAADPDGANDNNDVDTDKASAATTKTSSKDKNLNNKAKPKATDKDPKKPNTNTNTKPKPKLKYDRKEYLALLKGVLELRGKHGVEAWKLEKVAYILGHWDVLGEEERALVLAGGLVTGGKADTASIANAGSDISMMDVEGSSLGSIMAVDVDGDELGAGVTGKRPRVKRTHTDVSMGAESVALSETSTTRRSKRTRK